MKKNLLLLSLFSLIVFSFSSCEKKLSKTDLLCRSEWVDYFEEGGYEFEQILRFHPNGVGVEKLTKYYPNGRVDIFDYVFTWYWTSDRQQALRMEYTGDDEKYVVLFLVDRLNRHVLEGELDGFDVFFEAM